MKTQDFKTKFIFDNLEKAKKKHLQYRDLMFLEDIEKKLRRFKDLNGREQQRLRMLANDTI